MKTLDVQGYTRGILKNTLSHLDSLAALLTLTQLKLSAQHVENVQIEDDKYASEAAVSICQKLAIKSQEIEHFIKELRKGRFDKKKGFSNPNNRGKRGSCLHKILLVSLLVGCTYIGIRHFKLSIK